ncbi:hypothetical protein EV421DRAFT_1254399 [Armillaria borealis]|uniref:Uncharacterized protein n=1 Tax=Armillaria borealis TaxID=47425 RepID=A0AA39MIZ4_9AGAR|nr:hypothetical protein EV421DRAFT_1254399 [Armillaria borealis]
MSWVLWGHPSERYIPSEQDVMSVKRILITYVPYELVEEILEIAHYWPGIRGDRQRSINVLGKDHPGEPCARAEWCFMVTPPIPQGESNKIYDCGFRKGRYEWIISMELEYVTLSSFDSISLTYFGRMAPLARGFKQKSYAGDHGGYGRWKEAGQLISVEVYSQETNDSRWFISERNGSSGCIEEITVDWPPIEEEKTFRDEKGIHGQSREFIGLLQPGDKIALMVVGNHPGWIYRLQYASIDIFYTLPNESAWAQDIVPSRVMPTAKTRTKSPPPIRPLPPLPYLPLSLSL